jgi:hypothetical protein
VADLFAEYEPELAQLRQMPVHRRLAHIEVGRDPSHVGLGDEAAALVERGVQGDVLQHAPGQRPDRALHRPTGREHLRERLRASDDATVGQHPAKLLAERHDIAGLRGFRHILLGVPLMSRRPLHGDGVWRECVPTGFRLSPH